MHIYQYVTLRIGGPFQIELVAKRHSFGWEGVKDGAAIHLYRQSSKDDIVSIGMSKTFTYAGYRS